ncbi:5'-nucleotidase [Tenacibaculum sp. 190524A02b]|uniref:5'-nucleotidase n=1 Tax=Tenacibaculum vairaonense TaxID=3137860 RepID=UPI0032B29E51
MFSCKKKETQLTKITAKNIAVDTKIQASSTIDSVINPYKEKLEAQMQQVLSYTPKDLVKTDGEMQSSLGNLLADLCFDIANPIFNKQTNEFIDFAMFNHGGMRARISKGDIRVNDAFKLMPFENELVVAEITGEKMMELVKYFKESKRAHPLSNNIELSINQADFNLKINGKKFDKNKTYKVLTSDYLQNGGSNMVFFKNPKKLSIIDCKVRDAIISYFKKVDTIKTTIDNRITIK